MLKSTQNKKVKQIIIVKFGLGKC